VWQKECYFPSQDNKHPQHGEAGVLEPILSTSPHLSTSGRHHPFSGVYTLERDQENTRGLSYIRRISKQEINKMEEDHRKLSLPSEDFSRVEEDGNISYSVPGMVQAPLGVPFRAEYVDFPLKNGPGFARETRVVVHDTHSLSICPGGEDIPAKFEKLVTTLRGGEDERPLWELLKANYRTEGKSYGKNNVDMNDKSRYDGSYSLATTIGEGQGYGTVQVAVQPGLENDPAGIWRLNLVLLLAAEIAMFTLLHSLTDFEFSMVKYYRDRNHVTCFGDGVFSGCQLNVSSSKCRSLAEALGIQGQLHVDGHDDPAAWTVFILMIELREGQFI
jgi:hypothetical protein